MRLNSFQRKHWEKNPLVSISSWRFEILFTHLSTAKTVASPSAWGTFQAPHMIKWHIWNGALWDCETCRSLGLLLRLGQAGFAYWAEENSCSLFGILASFLKTWSQTSQSLQCNWPTLTLTFLLKSLLCCCGLSPNPVGVPKIGTQDKHFPTKQST